MRKWIMFIVFIIIFIFSAMMGFFVNSFIQFSREKKNTNPAILAESENNEEKVVDTSFSNVIVSPNAELILTQKYKKCGHTIVSKETVPRDVINLDRDKFQEYFKDWNIDEFNSNEIKISKECSGICNEHYILRESDGYISISCKNNIGEYIFKGLTDISVQYLTEEDLSRLEKGIEIVGKDSLNKFLEDFE